MKSQKTTATSRKKYTAQFKDRALEHAERDVVKQAAAALGIAEGLLYNWRAERQQTGLPAEHPMLQQAEVTRLKRDKAHLEEEVAFLKKAAASHGDS